MDQNQDGHNEFTSAAAAPDIDVLVAFHRPSLGRLIRPCGHVLDTVARVMDTVDGVLNTCWCANMAHIRQSRPDFGLGFWSKNLETFESSPSRWAAG